MAETHSLGGAGTPYRGDIDGLRAIAVLLVIAYHASFPFITGGYIGVDVFFVISGFLITGVLLTEQRRTGRVSVLNFWGRRLRRLLPLASTVILFTVVVGIGLLAPLARGRMLWDGASSLFYVSNLRFAGQSTSYSDIEVTDSLFLHYWSLAVEEQYYVVWPIIFVGVTALAARVWLRPLKGVLFWFLAAGTGASLWASVALTNQLGPGAYYLPHTRFWEIGAGGLLALGAHRLNRLSKRFSVTLRTLGLSAIAASALTFTVETRFPGYLATIPVLGALCVLAAGITSGHPTSRLLSAAPVAYLGRISYALYLWHWPLLGLTVLANIRWEWGLADWHLPALALILTLAFSAVSHIVIENPVRYSRSLMTSLKKTYVAAAVAMGVPALAIGALLLAGDLGGRTPDSKPPAAGGADPYPMTPLEASQDQVTIGPDDCHIAQDDPAPNKECVAGDLNSDRVVVLFGDSHARHWLPALDRAGELYGWKVLTQTKSACTPYDVRIYNINFEREYWECLEWSRSVLEHLGSMGEVQLVVISRSLEYGNVIVDNAEPTADQSLRTRLWREGARRTYDSLDTVADRLVVLEDTPRGAIDIPTCLSEHGVGTTECDIVLAEGLRGQELLAAEREAGRSIVSFITMNDVICESDPCPVVTTNGVIKYRDGHHLTQGYSITLAEELGRRLGLLGEGEG